MYTKMVLMTPEMAKEILTRETKNRKLRQSRIDAYARDITEGNWKQTGETIKFGIDGRPLDGQHRLSAIVKANKVVPMLCAYDVDDSAFDYIDTGMPRLAADILGMAGVANTSTVVGALRLCVLFERGMFDGSARGGGRKDERRNISNHEVVEAMAMHPGIHDAVTTYNRLMKDRNGSNGLMMGGSLASFFIYQFSKQNAEKASEFFLALAGRVAPENGSPVFKLRERLISNRISKAKLPAKDIAAMTIKSWVQFRDGKKANERLGFKSTEEFPSF